MRDLGLPDRIRAKAVPVVGVAGWDSLGISTGFQPRIALLHHTAGSSFGSVPSLGICRNGRSDLPGPLCQVLQSREPEPWDDKAYLIASGKANHAGVGNWQGYDSNYEAHGLEVEHIGTTSVHKARLEVSARIIAAMLEAPGGPRNSAYACQHFEYARPLGRKIDFHNLGPRFTTTTFRQRVGFWIGRTTTVPVGPNGPDIEPPEEDWFSMATEAELRKIVVEQTIPRRLVHTNYSSASDDPVYISDLLTYKIAHANGDALDDWHKAILSLNDLPTEAHRLPQALIDQIPDHPGV